MPWPARVLARRHEAPRRDPRGVVVRDIATKERRLVKPDNGAMTTNGRRSRRAADRATLLVQPSHVRSRSTAGTTPATRPVRVFDLKQLRWGGPEHEPNDDTVGPNSLRTASRVVGLLGNRWACGTPRLARQLLRIAIPANDRRADGQPRRAVGRDARVARPPAAVGLRRPRHPPVGRVPLGEGPRPLDERRPAVVVFRGDGRLETFDAATLRTLTSGRRRSSRGRRTAHLVRVLADGQRVLFVNDRKREAVLYTADGEVVARFSSLASMDVLEPDPAEVLTARQCGAVPVAGAEGRRDRLPARTTPRRASWRARSTSATTWSGPGGTPCRRTAGGWRSSRPVRNPIRATPAPRCGTSTQGRGRETAARRAARRRRTGVRRRRHADG